MRRRNNTHDRTSPSTLGAWATADPVRIGRVALVITVLLGLTLALASRAEAYVYWTNTYFNDDLEASGTIGRANPDGSGANQRFLTGMKSPCGLTVDASHIYWADDGIGRADIDGSGVQRDFINDVAAYVCGVTVDVSHLYWGDSGVGAPHDEGSDRIGRANLDGTGVNPDFITALNPGGVAVDTEHVYWANRGSIGRADIDGSGVDATFIEGVSASSGVAVNTEHIYWANSSNLGHPGATAIGRANLDGTGVNPDFITGLRGIAFGVTVDGEHIYWTKVADNIGRSGTLIGRANLDGTGVDQRFITGASSPGGVAVDALPGFGKLKRNRKRGTAKLTVIVAGSGELKLAKTGKVKGAKKQVRGEQRVELPIKPRRKAKRMLAAKGKSNVKAKITSIPDGGEPNTQAKRTRLIKRR